MLMHTQVCYPHRVGILMDVLATDKTPRLYTLFNFEKVDTYWTTGLPNAYLIKLIVLKVSKKLFEKYFTYLFDILMDFYSRLHHLTLKDYTHK